MEQPTLTALSAEVLQYKKSAKLSVKKYWRHMLLSTVCLIQLHVTNSLPNMQFM